MHTNRMQSKVMLVDDQPNVLEALRIMFCDEYDVLCAASGADAIKLIEQHQDIAVVVIDIKMSEIDGITAGRQIRELRPDIPVIFHTAYPGEFDERQVTDAEQPFDYVTKGEPSARLRDSVKRAVLFRKMQDNRLALLDTVDGKHSLVTRSHAMQTVLKTMYRVGMSQGKVLITGEAGTGKKHIAQIIHSCGRRSEKPFAVFRCGEKSPPMIESELFGHIAGAFPGASEDSMGLFEYADSGTIYFEMIDELDLVSQTRVLGVLEAGQYRPIGSPSPRTCDVRIVCSTRKNLAVLVKANKFREDLALLIKGVTIRMPPLRDRSEDIPFLARIFVNRYTATQDLQPRILDSSAMSVLLEYPWPGNVRQLIDTIEAVISLSDSELIIAKDVMDVLGTHHDLMPASDRCLSSNLAKMERRLIVMALVESDYNISNAAAAIDIDRSSLSRKIKKYNIDTRALREASDDEPSVPI